MQNASLGSPARFLLALITAILAGCAPGAPAAAPQTGSGEVQPGSAPAAAQPARTLVAGIRVEPASVATRGLRPTGVALYLSRRLFNAEIALFDGQGQPRPYLVEALPQLNTDSWQVFPDGRMETTYRLRPNLTWHDGAPLTPDDFVFAHRVYSTPDFGESTTPPWVSIEEVTALDARTLRIRWNRPHPDAGNLAARDREFPPLPRHLLGQAFQDDSADTFANNPWWTRQYVGLGPFRLDRWEPGAFIEATAFDGHALGRPKVERVKVLFIADGNVTAANLLTGDIQLSADTSIRLEQVAMLKRDWIPRGQGNAIQHPNQWRAAHFQLRPDAVTPKALLDIRVRRALAHTVDRQAISDTVYDGDGVFSDSMVSPLSEHGPATDRAVAKYPFDPRRSEQLMAEAGFTKVGGFYTSPTEGRFTADLKTNAAADNEQEIAIMAAGWRELGFEVQESVLAAALAQDSQARATFSGMFANNSSISETLLVNMTTSGIPRPENRWNGSNRGGWSNPQFDSLVPIFNTTLDRAERTRLVAQMAKIYTEDIPSISLFFRTQPWAHAAALRGIALVAPESSMAWNVHEWELR